MKKRVLIIAACIFYLLPVWAQPCASSITAYPYIETFEDDDGGWITGGIASDWTWGTPNKSRIISGAGGSQKCWITGGLAKPSYNEGQRSWLLSPCFDFSNIQEPELFFSIFWDTEREFDGASLQYSLDDGNTWVFIGKFIKDMPVTCESINWFNAEGVFGLFGWPGWAGNTRTGGACSWGAGSSSWLASKHLIHQLGGQSNVRFRFYFGVYSNCNDFNGFAIDNFTLRESPANSASFSSTCRGGNTVDFFNLSECAVSLAWNFGDPASGTANTSAAANPFHTYPGPGAYEVTLDIDFLYGAPASLKKTIYIIGGTPVQNWPGACSNTADATLGANVTGSANPYTYQWNTSPPQSVQFINNAGPGNYTLTVTSLDACPAKFDFSLASTNAVTVSSSTTDAACKRANGKIVSTVTGGETPYSFLWNNGTTGSTASGLLPGNYSLVVTDAKGCRATHTPKTVGANDYTITINLGADRLICPGQTNILSPGYFADYLWQDGSRNSTFKANRPGNYFVTVTDANGCEARDTVRFSGECKDIYFPSVFSPNKDNINDEFGPIGDLPALENFYMSIFDRYGNKLFHSTDPYQRWSGEDNQTRRDMGTYVWVSEFIYNGRRQIRKGSVTLLR